MKMRYGQTNLLDIVRTNMTESFLSDNCPPMGIYETLYAFKDSFGSCIGTEGTHPWSQGFPLTTPLEKFDGPSMKRKRGRKEWREDHRSRFL